MDFPAGDLLGKAVADFGVSVVLGTALGLGPRRFRDARYSDLARRVSSLESRSGVLTEMNITQVPGKWFTSGRFLQKPEFIVIHWMDGTLESTDRVFAGKTDRTKVSAHFGVEGPEVHQYVKLGNTAWHAGNWIANLKSVGIECSAQPGRDASDETIRTVASLVCMVCRSIGKVPSRELLRKHSEFRPTACPGTIDLARIAALAVAEWNGRRDTDVSNAPQGTLTSSVPVTFRVRVNAPVGRANFRKEANTSSQTEGTYENGREFDCDATVPGQTVSVTWEDGRKAASDKWYRSVPDELGNQYFISAAVSTHL